MLNFTQINKHVVEIDRKEKSVFHLSVQNEISLLNLGASGFENMYNTIDQGQKLLQYYFNG